MGKTSLEAVAGRGMRRYVQFGFAEMRGVARRAERMRVTLLKGFQMEEME